MPFLSRSSPWGSLFRAACGPEQPDRRTGPPEGWAGRDQGRVRFGETTLEYQVRRSERRKKVHITVNGADVRIAAPKRFVSGETLLYLGRKFLMVVERADVRSPEGPLRPLALSGRRAAGPRRRCALRTNPPLRRRMVSGPGRRTPIGGRWPLVASPGSGSRAARPHPRSAPALGELRPRRHATLQLARHDASVRAHRVHRRSRACPPDAPEPLGGLLGIVSGAMPDAQERRRHLREAGRALPL